MNCRDTEPHLIASCFVIVMILYCGHLRTQRAERFQHLMVAFRLQLHRDSNFFVAPGTTLTGETSGFDALAPSAAALVFHDVFEPSWVDAWKQCVVFQSAALQPPGSGKLLQSSGTA